METNSFLLMKFFFCVLPMLTAMSFISFLVGNADTRLAVLIGQVVSYCIFWVEFFRGKMQSYADMLCLILGVLLASTVLSYWAGGLYGAVGTHVLENMCAVFVAWLGFVLAGYRLKRAPVTL